MTYPASMSRSPDPPEDPSAKPPASATRRARVADALRANLRRRKDARKTREEEGPEEG